MSVWLSSCFYKTWQTFRRHKIHIQSGDTEFNCEWFITSTIIFLWIKHVRSSYVRLCCVEPLLQYFVGSGNCEMRRNQTSVLYHLHTAPVKITSRYQTVVLCLSPRLQGRFYITTNQIILMKYITPKEMDILRKWSLNLDFIDLTTINKQLL